MSNLTINNGGIITNSRDLPNLDLRYGPYDSIESATEALGDLITPGLTIGIQNNERIIEYQVNNDYEFIPKTSSAQSNYDDLENLPKINNIELKGNKTNEQLGIPTKTSDLVNDSGFISEETEPSFDSSPAKDITENDITNWNNKSDFSGSYNDLTNKPIIPSKTSDLVNDSGFISSESEPAFNSSVAKNITENDITNWNSKQEELESGTNIKTINNESILGNGNIIIPRGEDGTPGNNGHNPCLGRFSAVQSTFTETLRAGDYYFVDTVDTSTTPPTVTETKIYKYDGTQWDSGAVVDVSNLTFNSGETVTGTSIDGTGLANPAANALAKAEDVRDTIQELSYTSEDIDISETPTKRSIKDDGTWGSDSYRHITIPVSAGQIYAVTANPDNAARLVFLSQLPETIVENETAPYVLWNGEIRHSIAVSRTEIFQIPNGVNYLYIYSGAGTQRTYNPSSVKRLTPIKDIISANDLKHSSSIDSIIDRMHWELAPMKYRYRLSPRNGVMTKITTTGSTLTCYYAPCKKGDIFKVSNLVAYTGKVYFCENIPEENVSISGKEQTLPAATESGSSDIVILAPIDGYICIERTKYIYTSILYKVSAVDMFLFPKTIANITWVSGKSIYCGDDTAETVDSNYGNEINYISSYALSNEIDVSQYKYLLVPCVYSTGTSINPSINASIGGTGILGGSMFYDENHQPLNSFCEIVYSNIYKYELVKVDVPDGAKYARISANSSLQNNIYALSNEVSASVDVAESLENDAKTWKKRSIFEYNPDIEWGQKMLILRRRYYADQTFTDSKYCFSFAHISDIHGSGDSFCKEQLERFIEFANHWKDAGYVDELVDTGDSKGSTYNTSSEWRDSCEGVENILFVPGNHDPMGGSTEMADDGYTKTIRTNTQYHSAVSVNPAKRQDCYNTFIAPYVSNWGVTQPSNAAASGLCYWYKDYDAKRIRIIGIDEIAYDAAQAQWLEDRLDEAVLSGNHVIIFTHFRPHDETFFECTYSYSINDTNTGSLAESIGQMNEYVYNGNGNDIKGIAQLVDEFQNNFYNQWKDNTTPNGRVTEKGDGGFVGYFVGHAHSDNVGYLTNYPRQLVFNVGSGGESSNGEFSKNDKSKSWDNFQIVGVCVESRLIRLAKVGADIDRYCRHKEMLCVSYKVIDDNGTLRVEGIKGGF